jgi:chemotaxis protein CheX
VDVKYVNPFLESFTTVMPQLGYSNIQKGELSVKGEELVNSGVIIIIGIVGKMRGNVVYSLGAKSAKSIASTMMGMPIDELDEISKSALSELANMLTASAATSFYNLGLPIDISTPTLLQGENISIKMSSNQVLCVQLMADDNVIEVNISFEK